MCMCTFSLLKCPSTFPFCRKRIHHRIRHLIRDLNQQLPAYDEDLVAQFCGTFENPHLGFPLSGNDEVHTLSPTPQTHHHQHQHQAQRQRSIYSPSDISSDCSNSTISSIDSFHKETFRKSVDSKRSENINEVRDNSKYSAKKLSIANESSSNVVQGALSLSIECTGPIRINDNSFEASNLETKEVETIIFGDSVMRDENGTAYRSLSSASLASLVTNESQAYIDLERRLTENSLSGPNIMASRLKSNSNNLSGFPSSSPNSPSETANAPFSSNTLLGTATKRELNSEIKESLLVHVRISFLEVVKSVYWRHIDAGKLPRNSHAAVALLYSIDVGHDTVHTPVRQRPITIP